MRSSTPSPCYTSLTRVTSRQRQWGFSDVHLQGQLHHIAKCFSKILSAVNVVPQGGKRIRPLTAAACRFFKLSFKQTRGIYFLRASANSFAQNKGHQRKPMWTKCSCRASQQASTPTPHCQHSESCFLPTKRHPHHGLTSHRVPMLQQWARNRLGTGQVALAAPGHHFWPVPNTVIALTTNTCLPLLYDVVQEI